MKRILINWYYDRPDLTKHLLELANDAQLIFIGKHFRPLENEDKKFNNRNITVVYWSDFHSPYQLLEAVKPDLVVFHDIEAFNQIALNIAARNNGIPTYVLQHGLRGGYEVQEALNHAGDNGRVELSDTSWWTLKFLMKSIRWKNFRDLFSLLKFALARKRKELTVALYENKFELRRADVYLEFSKANATYHQVRDAIPESRFRLIGNPGYDDFFQRINNFSSNDNYEQYCLLIDNPFCEASLLQKERMTLTEKNDYIKRLNEYCRRKQLKLYIKLHPLTYGNVDLFQDDNLRYFREADIVKLIGESQVVFLLHFATLIPLVLLYKPFIFFHNKYVDRAEALHSLSIPTFDLLTFTPEDLVTQLPHAPLGIDALRDYLYIPDGKSRERLGQILLAGT